MKRHQQESGAATQRVPNAAAVSEPLPAIGQRSSGEILTMVIPGLTLWFEAALVIACSDTFSLIAPIAALCGTLGLRFSLPFLSRPALYRSVLVAMGFVLLMRLFVFPPEVVERGFVVLPRTLTLSVAEFLLWWQVLVLWRWSTRDKLPASFSCLALVTCVLALNKTLISGTESAHVLLIIFALLVPTAVATRPTGPDRRHDSPMPWNARFALVTICFAMLVGTWFATAAWSSWLPDAQRWFANQVARIQVREHHMETYSVSGVLTTIRRQNTNNPTAEALKVYADKRPGYLASRIFDTYGRGRWHMHFDKLRRERDEDAVRLRIIPPLLNVPEPVHLLHQTSESTSIFQLGEEPRDWSDLARMTIKNDAKRGRVYFTPLGCRYFAGSGNRLYVDEYGIVRGDINVGNSYVAIADTTHSAEPLSGQIRQLLLETPRLDRRIETLAEQVCGSAATPSAKMKAVRDYFQNNYQYTLKSYGDHPGYDPMEHFLLEGDAAHCEFFASAAVILLRHQGVPTRYVTGYRVMQLEEDSGEYWLAMNRDAHAWAEAYDEQQQKWIIVEATPGFSDPAMYDLEGMEDETTNALGTGLALAAEGASEWLQWWKDLPSTVRNSVRVAFVLVLGMILFFSARRFRSLQSRLVFSAADHRIRPWLKLLKVMDHRMKRFGVTRDSAETIYQFAERIRRKAGGENPTLQAASQWYLDYADSRYRPTSEAPPPIPGS